MSCDKDMMRMSSQRNTLQRHIILDALKKLNTHPAIDEICAEIHQEHPKISKTTVYRNLRRLADNGTINRVSLPDGLERYDVRTDRHYHYKCKNCGRIIDVDIDYIDGINDTVQVKYGLQVDGHDVIFSGVCHKCKS